VISLLLPSDLSGNLLISRSLSKTAFPAGLGSLHTFHCASRARSVQDRRLSLKRSNGNEGRPKIVQH